MALRGEPSDFTSVLHTGLNFFVVEEVHKQDYLPLWWFVTTRLFWPRKVKLYTRGTTTSRLCSGSSPPRRTKTNFFCSLLIPKRLIFSSLTSRMHGFRPQTFWQPTMFKPLASNARVAPSSRHSVTVQVSDSKIKRSKWMTTLRSTAKKKEEKGRETRRGRRRKRRRRKKKKKKKKNCE